MFKFFILCVNNYVFVDGGILKSVKTQCDCFVFGATYCFSLLLGCIMHGYLKARVHLFN